MSKVPKFDNIIFTCQNPNCQEKFKLNDIILRNNIVGSFLEAIEATLYCDICCIIFVEYRKYNKTINDVVEYEI